MTKSVSLALITIVTIASICALVRFMGTDGFHFAWALNFLLMFCVLAFTEALKSQLTSAYYNEKEWERGGKIYEHLGINSFRKIIGFDCWEKLNKKANPVEEDTKALMNLIAKRERQRFSGQAIDQCEYCIFIV